MAHWFRRSFDTFLNAGLLAAMLCVAIVSTFWARIAGSINRRRHNPAPILAQSSVPAAGEFQFEHALEAYEDVIDELLTEHRA
jgi:hypothetical protein